MSFLSPLEKSRKTESSSDATSSRTAAVREEEEDAALGSTVDESVQIIEQLIAEVTGKIKEVDLSIDKTIREYGKDLKEELVHLEKTTLHDLEKEKDQLRKEEEHLRNKVEDLRKEKKLLLKESRRQELSELPVEFDPGNSILNNVKFEFDFIQIPEYHQLLKRLSISVNEFMGWETRKRTTHLYFPIVEGAGGTGKSRLCWEVAKGAAAQMGGLHLYFDCSKADNAYSKDEDDESAERNYTVTLAKVLFDHLVDKRVHTHAKYSFTLDTVLKKIKHDTGATVVVLQVDEYSCHPVITKMILRACRDIMLLGLEFGPGVVVLPILSGNGLRYMRAGIFREKMMPQFFSLRGISGEQTHVLWDMFDKVAMLGKKSSEIRNLAMILTTLGGFPRLFEWLFKMIVDMRDSPTTVSLKKGYLSSDDAQMLYSALLDEYRKSYGFTQMADFLRTGEKAASFECTFKWTVEYLKRIHTLAITGHKVNINWPIWKDTSIGNDDGGDNGSRSLQHLTASGLFTLSADRNDDGTITLPLIAIDACCAYTGIAPPGTLSPFVYSWAWIEIVAMVSLRCRWNSLWYSRDRNSTAPYMATVRELRPGALFNQEWIETSPTVEIDRELPGIILLAAPFKGNTKTKFPTGMGGKDSGVLVVDRSIFVMSANETGNVGGAILEPFAWLTQCKSRDILAERGTDLSQEAVSKIQAAQAKAASAFDFGKETTIVIYDIFTNRREGARLDTSLIPHNTFVTSMSNIEAVVGPLFGMSKRLFEDTETD